MSRDGGTLHTDPGRWPQLGPGEPPTPEQEARWLEALKPPAITDDPEVRRAEHLAGLDPESVEQLRRWLEVGKADLERQVAP